MDKFERVFAWLTGIIVLVAIALRIAFPPPEPPPPTIVEIVPVDVDYFSQGRFSFPYTVFTADDGERYTVAGAWTPKVGEPITLSIDHTGKVTVL